MKEFTDQTVLGKSFQSLSSLVEKWAESMKEIGSILFPFDFFEEIREIVRGREGQFLDENRCLLEDKIIRSFDRLKRDQMTVNRQRLEFLVNPLKGWRYRL